MIVRFTAFSLKVLKMKALEEPSNKKGFGAKLSVFETP